ncbi:MAG TPA: SDR family oxidoreductase [Hyphomicrobiaceae bacterium]|nr:SDR family oxidoreductase [Hyphomicrobiaceae bacterium]
MNTATTHTKAVLITGAGRRIGRELALDLARHGWRVGIHYRQSEDAAHAVIAEIRETGGVAAAFGADLSDSQAAGALIPACAAELGPVTCLINNASEFVYDSAATMTDQSWSTHLDVNLKAPVFLARALAAELPEGTTGNVINIIDQRVWNLTPEFFSYTVSKAGLWSATRMLAQALAPRVRVNAIGPGPVLQSVHQTEADFATELASTLLGRGTTPGEIADAIRFILDAPALTGQMLALDGGQHLAWSHAESPASNATPSGLAPQTN